MTTLFAAIILIGIIVFIHELGHYLAARSIGVKVERFSVGFPPRLMTFTSIPNGWEFRLFFYKKNVSPSKWRTFVFLKMFFHFFCGHFFLEKNFLSFR